MILVSAWRFSCAELLPALLFGHTTSLQAPTAAGLASGFKQSKSHGRPDARSAFREAREPYKNHRIAIQPILSLLFFPSLQVLISVRLTPQASIAGCCSSN